MRRVGVVNAEFRWSQQAVLILGVLTDGMIIRGDMNSLDYSGSTVELVRMGNIFLASVVGAASTQLPPSDLQGLSDEKESCCATSD
jgi:hypothetical protein